MQSSPDNGLLHLNSPYSVMDTAKRLETTLQAKGITLFCRVDHSGEAEKIGMKMNPTQLLIFGSPKAGTPLMVASPALAIDLPLKVLILEDASGKVWLTFNSPDYLQHRHNIPPELMPNISGLGALLQAVVAS